MPVLEAPPEPLEARPSEALDTTTARTSPNRGSTHLAVTLLAILAMYCASYVFYRDSNAQITTRDGQTYIVYTDSQMPAYYFYRPAAYIDSRLTGAKMHIGPVW
ncbi:MAG: hypothetical protein JO317_01640 [Verrucomicrobiae bacterium]|nr:hypothetical protein [Verrucomicrobiae bacterium]